VRACFSANFAPRFRYRPEGSDCPLKQLSVATEQSNLTAESLRFATQMGPLGADSNQIPGEPRPVPPPPQASFRRFSASDHTLLGSHSPARGGKDTAAKSRNMQIVLNSLVALFGNYSTGLSTSTKMESAITGSPWRRLSHVGMCGGLIVCHLYP